MIALWLALTPDAMSPVHVMALALRNDAVAGFEDCQVAFDQWEGQVFLGYGLEDGAVTDLRVLSNTTDDRSRIVPDASIAPGRSSPGAPKRSSFMLSSPCSVNWILID